LIECRDKQVVQKPSTGKKQGEAKMGAGRGGTGLVRFLLDRRPHSRNVGAGLKCNLEGEGGDDLSKNWKAERSSRGESNGRCRGGGKALDSHRG